MFLSIPATPRKAFYFLGLLTGLLILFSGTWPVPVEVQSQPAPEKCTTCSSEVPRTIYAPTIGFPEADPGNIVLNCRSADPIEATPTFYTESGVAIVGTPFQLQPAEMRFVTIESLIPEQQRGQHTWGGMSISYTGHLMEVWAQITLPGAGQRGSTDVTFSVINNLGSDTHEAVWWQPKPGKRVIALGNSSDGTIVTTAEFSNGHIEHVSIAPYATQYLRKTFSDGNDRPDSVKLTTIGPAGSLKAAGYVISNNGSDSHRFASSIRFYDTNGVVQPKLFANNFRVKNSVSHLLLKNTASSPITAHPKFRPTDGTGNPVTLSEITLAPGEAREVNLQPLHVAAANREDLESVSVQINNNGPAGSLIGSLYSKNLETGVGYDIPLRDSGRMRNSTGGYPFRLDDDFRTVVTLTNTGNNPVQFIAALFYDGGHYSVSPQAVEPGGTAKFNLNRIRDEAIPDAFGHTLPASATTGQFKWSIIRPTDSDRLIGRSEVVSRSNRVSNSYSCGLSCPASGPFFNYFIAPYTPILAAGEIMNTEVQESWFHEGGGGYTYPGNYPNLNIADSNIAEASVPQTGLIETEGIAAGTSTWFSGVWLENRWFDGGFDCFVDQTEREHTGPVEVACATPANFRQTIGRASGGNLEFEYRWDSSTGKLSDLSQCTVGELVTYPGSGNYFPQSPPFPAVPSGGIANPTELNAGGQLGVGSDIHSPGGCSFVTPYQAASYTSTQIYRYKCPCKENGAWQQLMGPLDIVRSVSQSGSNWKYTITKSGVTATINPLP